MRQSFDDKSKKNLLKKVPTFETVRAGDHWDRRMSRQMAPLLLMLGW